MEQLKGAIANLQRSFSTLSSAPMSIEVTVPS